MMHGRTLSDIAAVVAQDSPNYPLRAQGARYWAERLNALLDPSRLELAAQGEEYGAEDWDAANGH